MTVLKVEIEEINFKDGANHDIKIDDTIGDIGPGVGDDIEWIKEERDDPNSIAPWNTDQSAPAAFTKGSPITAAVSISVQPPTIPSVKIWGENTGAYGNFLEQTVSISGGTGTASFTTDLSTAVNRVDVNDLTFSWKVKEITDILTDCDIRDTTHRIYTLNAPPISPMDPPWATVLELSCGMIKEGIPLGAPTEKEIVEEMTRGVHYSKWKVISNPKFLNPMADLNYNFSITRTRVIGPGVLGRLSRFSSQIYDLTNFMASVITPSSIQQCSDNAVLLSAVLLRSIGVNMTPKAFSESDPITGPLKPAIYFPAGAIDLSDKVTQTPSSPTLFGFHQIGFFEGEVYDPSTRPSLSGDPFMGLPLLTFVNMVFPGQGTVVEQDVTDITIGAVPFSPPVFNSVTPNNGNRGSAVTVTIRGSNLRKVNFLLDVFPGTISLVPGVFLSNETPISDTERQVTITIATTAAPGIIELVAGDGPAIVARIQFTINP